MSVDVAFDLDLTHGRCVIVRIPLDAVELEALERDLLAPEEQAACAAFPFRRRRTWAAGRAALREALGRVGCDAAPVLADDRGAPALPQGITGSISHKEAFAAALVAAGPTDARIGVDLEDDVDRSIDIATKVLCDDEIDEIAGLSPRERSRAVLLRFSAKESIYKALDPYVRRYVGFKEMVVSPCDDGSCRVTPRLPEHEGPFAFEARWLRLEGLLLTTARVEKRSRS